MKPMGNKNGIGRKLIMLVLILSMSVTGVLASLTLPEVRGAVESMVENIRHSQNIYFQETPDVVGATMELSRSELANVSSFSIYFNSDSRSSCSWPSGGSRTITRGRGGNISTADFFVANGEYTDGSMTFTGSPSTAIYCCNNYRTWITAEVAAGRSGATLDWSKLSSSCSSGSVHASRQAWCAHSVGENQAYDNRVGAWSRPPGPIEEYFANANRFSFNGRNIVTISSNGTATLNMHAVWLSGKNEPRTQQILTERSASTFSNSNGGGGSSGGGDTGGGGSGGRQDIPCAGRYIHDCRNNVPQQNMFCAACELRNNEPRFYDCLQCGRQVMDTPNGICVACERDNVLEPCPDHPSVMHRRSESCWMCDAGYCNHGNLRNTCGMENNGENSGVDHNCRNHDRTNCYVCSPPPASVTYDAGAGSFSDGSRIRTAMEPTDSPIANWITNRTQPGNHPDECPFERWDYGSATTVPRAGMTMTAIWGPAPPKNINLTWNPNGLTRYEPSTFTPPMQVTIARGENSVAMTLPEPWHPTYTLNTWTVTGANGYSRTGLQNGSTITFERSGPTSFTLIPVWNTDLATTRPYTITLTPGFNDATADWLAATAPNVTRNGDVFEMTVRALNDAWLPAEAYATRTNFRHTGWRVVTTGATITTEIELGYHLKGMASQNIEVEALWRAAEYEVHFNSTMGEFPSGQPTGWQRRNDKLMVFTGVHGSQVNEPSRPTSEDFEFVTWRLDDGRDFLQLSSYTMETGGATVYAEWREINRTLRLHVNPPNGENLPTSVSTGSQIPNNLYIERTYVRGSDQTAWVQGLDSFRYDGYPEIVFYPTLGSDYETIPGYRFVGWSASSDSLQSYPQLSNMTRGELLDPATNTYGVNLYAIWEAREYNIHYDLSQSWDQDSAFQPGQANPIVVPVTYRQQITPLTAAEVYRTGYDLHSWHAMDVSFGLGIPVTGFQWPQTMPHEDIYVKAAWTPKQITLRYNPGLGRSPYNATTTIPVRSSSGQLQDPAVDPETDPTLRRYFVGWYSRDGSASGNWDDAFRLDSALGFFMPVVDGPVYDIFARWTDPGTIIEIPDPYTLFFDAQGGRFSSGVSVAQISQLFSGDQVVEGDLPAAPEMAGFEFAGWYTEPCVSGCDGVDHTANGCSNTRMAIPYTVGGSNLQPTFYARWNAKLFEIKFMNVHTGLQIGQTQYAYVNDSLADFAINVPDMGEDFIAGGWWTENGYIDGNWNENTSPTPWGTLMDLATARMGADDLTLYTRYYPLRVQVQYVNVDPSVVITDFTDVENLYQVLNGPTPPEIRNGQSHTVRTAAVPNIGIHRQIGWSFLPHGVLEEYKLTLDVNNTDADYTYIGDEYWFGMNGPSVGFMELLILGIDQHVATQQDIGRDQFMRLLIEDPTAIRNSIKSDYIYNGLGVLRLYPVWEAVDLVTITLNLPETHIDPISLSPFSGNLLRVWTMNREAITNPSFLPPYSVNLPTSEFMNNTAATGIQNTWVDSLNRPMIGQWAGVSDAAGTPIGQDKTRFEYWYLQPQPGSGVGALFIDADGVKVGNNYATAVLQSGSIGWQLTGAQLRPYMNVADGMIYIRAHFV